MKKYDERLYLVMIAFLNTPHLSIYPIGISQCEIPTAVKERRDKDKDLVLIY